MSRVHENLIIGAGIVGAFTAYRLAQMGERVTLLERKAPGLEASGVNAGSLAVQNKPIRLVPLSRLSVQLWEQFEQETGLSTGYRRTGGLRLAHTPELVAELQRVMEAQRRAGLEVEFLDAGEARRLCPALGPAVLAAAYCPWDGHNNALVAVLQVVRAAAARGAHVMTGAAALRITPDGDGYAVETTQGRLLAARVVICAGPWAPALTEPLGFPIRLVPKVNILMVTEPAREWLPYMITHASHRLTMKQVAAGSVIIGGGWQGHMDWQANRKWPSLAGMAGNAALAVQMFPLLGQMRVIRSWAGLEANLPDELPLVGEIPGRPNAWVCTSSWGAYTNGPALGTLLARWIVTGRQPDELAGFAPGQRAIGREPTFVEA